MTIANKIHLLALKGYRPNLVNDDNGNWALSFCSAVDITEGGMDEVSVMVDPEEWHPTIEGAVDYAIGQLNEYK